MVRQILIVVITFWLSSFSVIGQAVLSISTVQFIIGNAPQFNTELEQQITEHRLSLLHFNYLGGTYNNETMPLIDPWQTINNFIQQVTLAPITLNEGDVIDADGDKEFNTQFDNISVIVRDKNNQAIDPNSNFCENLNSAPMRLEISTDINLSSRYGVPNTTSYDVTKTYFIHFKPTICYLKPSLTYGGGKYAGDEGIWNPEQGYIYDETKTTFPTTGMNGLSYDVKLLGVNVLEDPINMIYSSVAVGLILTPIDSQTLNIKLVGPTADNPKTYTANIFHILIGSIHYSFKINNWFIHNNDQTLAWSDANSWCNQLGGSQRYQLPAITQLSNGSTTGVNKDYTRAIGQGLLAEWGSLVSYGLMDYNYIWSGTQRIVGSYFDAHNATGFISSPLLSVKEASMCVSK